MKLQDSKLTQRAALVCSLTAALLFAAGVPVVAQGSQPKIIVLGFDGMDYTMARHLMQKGDMPNFKRLVEGGHAQPLGTSMPPLSPVAWSTFITGMNPAGHGIFDFIHRDPETLFPYLSTSAPREVEDMFEVGKYHFALGGGGHELLRRGTPFWEVLEDTGVETTVIRMPANFPPSGSASRELSGMGTIDLLGGYGTFTFFSSDIFLDERDLAGGRIRPLDLWNGVAEGTLEGPDNPFLQKRTQLTTDFTLYVDDREDVAKLVLGDSERILRIGEWTDWIEFDFEMMPDILGFIPNPIGSLPGMARFYLRQVRPEIELYVSPLNFDPSSGDLEISTPDDYAEELAELSGKFYTQGMPEDTQALKGKVLTPTEFLQQAEIAGDEVERQYEPVLERFDGGLLFYYFGNLDLVSHMMWHSMDEEHPAFDEERWGPHRDVVRQLYKTADNIVGKTLDEMDDDTTLVVMSDHGFASWRRTVSLNAWLRDNGYLVLKKGKTTGSILGDVDWSRTRAYGIGLNGLYINVRGRESKGIVDAGQKDALLREIEEKLLAEIDPETGEPSITKVYPTARVFGDGPYLEIGPDMVIGYAKGTRGDSDSALGEIEAEVYTDNVDDWGADHGMDHEAVPGVFFSSRKLTREVTSLMDLAAAILAEFGIAEFPVATDS
jgi:predicted AlkP superfamily phosphohydrolase/phosphomutase